MDTNTEQRITWTTRINIRPSAQALIRIMASHERVSAATILGYAIEKFVTAGSST